MILRKSVRVTLTAFLLLIFSAAILPPDFLHHHETETLACPDQSKHTSCDHKVHVSKKAAFCFACKFHIDKVYEATTVYESVTETPYQDQFCFWKESFTSTKTCISRLRGPPSFPDSL